jgi:hypothetical protein
MENAKVIISILEQLRPLVNSVSTTRVRRGNLFGFCLRASFSKAFDFVDNSFNENDDNIAFFRTAALRMRWSHIVGQFSSFVKVYSEV